jgi:predicted GNAT superfamily acetyltransferase
VSDVTIRPFASIEDYRACVALQEETWGEGFSERVSPAILKVAQILGGVSSGAFAEDGRLVGFVFGLTGQRNGEVVHWSDMLAVRAELRDTGLGRRLKAYQREEVLSRGVVKMFWTFDPLRSRNAHLNVTRLGAVVREYVPDMYGDTDSPLHRGIGTDRFVALWLLASGRVERRVTELLSGSSGVRINVDPDVPFALAADVTGRWPRPGEPDLTLEDAAMRAAIPSDVGTLMQQDLELAVAWRRATRAAFAQYIARGYEVQEFERGGAVSAYLLAKIVEDES